MSRIELCFTEDTFTYETLMRVMATDITSGGQISIEAMTKMLSEARTRFMYSHDILEVQSDFDGLLYTDLASQYISRVVAHEELIFEVGLINPNQYGGDIAIRVTRRDSGEVVVQAKFGFVCYNFYTCEIIPLTEPIKKLIKSSQDKFKTAV